MFLSGSPNPYTFPTQSQKRVAPAPPVVLASVSLTSWFANKQPDKFLLNTLHLELSFFLLNTFHFNLSFFRWNSVLLKVYFELYCLLLFLKYLLFYIKCSLLWPCSSKSSCNLVCPPTQLRLSERVSFLQVPWNGRMNPRQRPNIRISKYINV